VTNAILPSASVETVEGVIRHDPLVDVAKRHLPLMRGHNSHADEPSIRVRWLEVFRSAGGVIDTFGGFLVGIVRVRCAPSVCRWARASHYFRQRVQTRCCD
jgi:hypothetical protein